MLNTPKTAKQMPKKSEEKQLSLAIGRKSIWYKMAALSVMLTGILACLSIIGAVFGIPMIWGAIHLYKAPDLAKGGDIKGYVENLNNYVLYAGIGEIIKSILALIGFLGLIGAAGYGVVTHMDQLGGTVNQLDAGSLIGLLRQYQ